MEDHSLSSWALPSAVTAERLQDQGPAPPAPGLVLCPGLGQLAGVSHEADGAAANIHLVEREALKVDAGAHGQPLGKDELVLQLLGQRLEAARDVDGVADRGERDGAAVAHLADDGWAQMEADGQFEERSRAFSDVIRFC
jgi:hypothetical protein